MMSGAGEQRNWIFNIWFCCWKKAGLGVQFTKERNQVVSPKYHDTPDVGCRAFIEHFVHQSFYRTEGKRQNQIKTHRSLFGPWHNVRITSYKNKRHYIIILNKRILSIYGETKTKQYPHPHNKYIHNKYCDIKKDRSYGSFKKKVYVHESFFFHKLFYMCYIYWIYCMAMGACVCVT